MQKTKRTRRPAQLYELEGATASLEGAVAYFGKPQEIHFLGSNSQSRHVFTLSIVLRPPAKGLTHRGHFH